MFMPPWHVSEAATALAPQVSSTNTRERRGGTATRIANKDGPIARGAIRILKVVRLPLVFRGWLDRGVECTFPASSVQKNGVWGPLWGLEVAKKGMWTAPCSL